MSIIDDDEDETDIPLKKDKKADPKVVLPEPTKCDLTGLPEPTLDGLDEDFSCFMNALPVIDESEAATLLDDIQLNVGDDVNPDFDLDDFDKFEGDENDVLETETGDDKSLTPDEICDGEQTAFASNYPNGGQNMGGYNQNGGRNPSWGGQQQQYSPPPVEFYKIMGYCRCDSDIPRVEQKFNQLERDFDSQIQEIKRLEMTLKRMNSQKYREMSINYYFDQNAKLGPQGRP